MSSPSRWILGFDASCGRCTEIATSAKAAAGERLEVLPLADVTVREFRTRALGDDAPWAPTLIRVNGDVVQAWTGPAMGIRLFMRLGPWASVKLFASLGDLARANRAAEPGQEQLARRRFLSISAGVGIAVGIVLTGKAPALADEAGRASAWVAANKDRLPKTYTEFSSHNITYRRAIYPELEPSVKQKLWSDQIAKFRQSHPNLTPQQETALAKLDAQVAESGRFRKRVTAKEADPRDEQLRDELLHAFGSEEVIALATVLGPPEPRITTEGNSSGNIEALVSCECSRQSDYCSYPAISGWKCQGVSSCTVLYEGCGWLYNYACDGMCFRCTC